MKTIEQSELLTMIETVVNESKLKENEFSYKIAQAALDGKKKVKIGDKEYPVKMDKKKAKQIVNEKDLNEKDTPHLKQYGAPQGSKRDKHLDYVQRLFKAADKLESEGKTAEAKKKRQRAYEARQKEEESRRAKGDYSKRKRKDTKKEADNLTESVIRELVREMLVEALSKKTKATLKKKAEKRGLTPSSVYAEFRKGLAAWASSGSRKGMSQHQWAHARVNSATPSKPWAVVKKSKAKKKKKKRRKKSRKK